MKNKTNKIISLLEIIFILIVFLSPVYLLNRTNFFTNNKTKQEEKTTNDKIIIFSPTKEEVVVSPFQVMGQARGSWYLEATFPIKLFDGNGKQIASTVGTAISDWMTEDFVPFMAQVSFDKPMTKNGTIVFKKDNPSGLPENDKEVSVPILFE